MQFGVPCSESCFGQGWQGWRAWVFHGLKTSCKVGQYQLYITVNGVETPLHGLTNSFFLTPISGVLSPYLQLVGRGPLCATCQLFGWNSTSKIPNIWKSVPERNGSTDLWKEIHHVRTALWGPSQVYRFRVNTISGIGNSKKQRKRFFCSAFFFVLQKWPFPRENCWPFSDLGKSSL